MTIGPTIGGAIAAVARACGRRPFATVTVSLALAAVSRGLGTDLYTAWRWLNAVCLVATVAGVARMAAGSGFALSIVLALMLGPAFVTMYLWAWSEPLFLLLVVAVVHVAARMSHQEEVHRLADPYVLPHVHVLRVAEVGLDLRGQTRLLTDLTDRCVLLGFAFLDATFGQAPGELAASGPARGEDHVDTLTVPAVDHPSRRHLLGGRDPRPAGTAFA